MVQVRTTRVGDVNATGFTAIAIKEGYSETIQVNLNASGRLKGITAINIRSKNSLTFFINESNKLKMKLQKRTLR